MAFGPIERAVVNRHPPHVDAHGARRDSRSLMRVPTAVPEMPRLPLTIVGGEPGAGKTTLLRQLVGQKRVGGATCCALTGNLSAELAELRARLGETAHVLIEARGDASLRRVAGYGYMPGYRLDGIIVVMNARDIHDRVADADLRRRMTTQLHVADILIVNKLDVVEHGKRGLHLAWLDEELPRLRVIETSQGRVAGSLLLGVSPEAARSDARAVPGNWETTTYRAPGRKRLPLPKESEEPRCRIWRIETDEPIAAHRFRRWISLLPRTVVRGNGEVLIEEDRQLRYHFHMIGHRWQLQREQPWGLAAPETQLTLVGM
jgi:G3E family GTPase